MSKSRHNKFRDWDDEDDLSYSKAREENKNRRKQKKLKAALKTKNIDELIDRTYDEE